MSGPFKDYGDTKEYFVVNPLAKPAPWWSEIYRRIKLFPWWLRYHRGVVQEAVLRDRIIELGTALGLEHRWLKRILRHAISEFSKKGLGADYGYHNIAHELEAAFFTLLAAKGQSTKKFSQKDTKYLFVAALFHDYDPLKGFDKPNEDSIERFIRNDDKIRKFIEEVGLNIDLVIAIIHRTAYPFRDEIAEHAKNRMRELFTNIGIPEDDLETIKHFEDLGWFLSVSERVAGYSLGNFEHSMDLARRNAHALGWHPSVINERSVKYFSTLKEEREMFDRVMEGIPYEYSKAFWDNVEAFKEAWNQELELKNLIRKQLKLISVVEKTGDKLESYLKESVINIYKQYPLPIRIDEESFRKSLSSRDTILIILRINSIDGDVIGYAKGGPLENYKLRRGTHDENMGKRNTAYLEPISVKSGYWGETGGHLLRLKFLNESIKCGYRFVTGYAHRDVITNRIKRGESIEIMQLYDPDKLDYYRADLSHLAYQLILADTPSVYVHQT